MSNTSRIAELEARMGQMEDLYKAVEEMQGHDIPELIERAREWEGIAIRIASIESYLGLNRETTSAGPEGNLGDAVRELRTELADVKAQLRVHTRALGTPGPNQGAPEYGRMRVPEPRCFAGARDAKELENFLFDMEQYFRAVRPDSEETKVTTATMYLVGDAKLWWRTKYEDIMAGRCTIDTWEDLKRELKSQFFPENVEYMARRQLRDLKQTGAIREYVKKFSALMLDIRDMSEKDKMFFFLEGLKPWARTELQRQRVQELPMALAAAERLTDYHAENPGKKSQAGSGPSSG